MSSSRDADPFERTAASDRAAKTTVTRAPDPLAETHASGGAADPLAETHASGGAAPGATLERGARIGRYVVTGVLGRGGMGVVYAAHDPDLDRAIAIKLLRPELRHARRRLLREGQAIARLTHPNVVIVHDVGTHGDDLFIAMELVPGTTLGGWMRAGEGRRRPCPEVLDRLLAAGRGLAAAHAAGLVHRDFKPDNVLLGEGGRVVVTDFGLATDDDDPVSGRVPPAAAPRHDVTVAGALVGTPAYMAPEQLAGRRADTRSDQYSFCVTLWEALYGARPYDPRDGSQPSLDAHVAAVTAGRLGPPPPDVPVPGAVRAALARGLAVDPAARFPSMAALLAALTPRPSRRRWIAAGAAAAVVAAAVAVAAVQLSGRRAVVAELPTACADAGAAIRAAWGDAQRATWRDAFGAQPWFSEEMGWFDDVAARWATLAEWSCRAETPAHPADPRLAACLGSAAEALRAAASKLDGYWPALPTVDCLRPTPTMLGLPSTAAMGSQGFAVLSPDGRQVAITAFREPPYVTDVAGESRPHTPVPGASQVIDWLPDGRLVVVRVDGAAELRAGVDGPATPLTAGSSDAREFAAALPSPDGRLLATPTPGGGLAVVAADDGALLGRVDGPAMAVNWEPDGRRLLVTIIEEDAPRLRLFDVSTRQVTELPARVHVQTTGVFSAGWVAPGRIALTGATAPVHGQFQALWTIDVDDHGALRGPPALRAVPPDDRLYLLEDAGDGRALVALYSAQERVLRLRDGRNEQLAASLLGRRVTGVDVAAGRLVAAGSADVVIADLAGETRAIVPVGGWRGVLRGDRLDALEPVGAGTWRVASIGLDGTTTAGAAFPWPAAAGVPALLCAATDVRTCAVTSRADGRVTLAPLVDGVPGPRVELRTSGDVADLSADGRRALVASAAGSVVEVALDTGASTRRYQAPGPGCRVDHARWVGDGPRAWLAVACPDRNVLVSIDAVGEPHDELRCDGWISSLVALPDGSAIYSAQDADPRLVVFDHL